MPTPLRPKEIDTLLLTSEASILRLLALHGVQAPSDIKAYRDQLRSQPEHLPRELAETLRAIAEMADDHGRELLTSTMGPLFVQESSNAYEFAAGAWLDNRDLFQRLHARRRFSHRGHFQEFAGREPRRLVRPDDQTMVALERWLGTAFEKRGASRHCQIRFHAHDECLVFEVSHGRPLRAQPVVEVEEQHTYEDVLELRPRQIDVVVYDNRTHRIRVCAPNAFTVRAYLQGFSEVLFDEVAWFTSDDIVCLHPLLAGPQAVARTPGLDRIELISLEYRIGGGVDGRVRVVSQDVFGALQRLTLEPQRGSLMAAELKMFFTGGGRGRRTKLRPPNRLVYDRSRDERVVRQFLELRGFLAPGLEDARRAG